MSEAENSRPVALGVETHGAATGRGTPGPRRSMLPKQARPTKAEEAAAYEMVWIRDHGSCVSCGTDRGVIQRDHRKNRSVGGLTTVDGLQLLCLPCHTWKTGHPAAALRDGLQVPSWADPAEWPARRRVRGLPTWVLYVRDTDYFEHPTGYRILAPAQVAELTDESIDGAA